MINGVRYTCLDAIKSVERAVAACERAGEIAESADEKSVARIYIELAEAIQDALDNRGDDSL